MNLEKIAKRRNEARWRGAGREWATPHTLFEVLNREFDFQLDPCATHKSAKCARFFSEGQNGLIKYWGPGPVFMNPPYGREIYQWTRKAVEASLAGVLVVGLLPAATDSKWWHEDILGTGAEIRYLRKRPRFEVYLPNGEIRWSSPFQPCVVVVWKPQ